MAPGLDPETMATRERLDEVAAILGAGFLRLRRREAAERPFSGENCLEVPAEVGPLVTVG